MCQYSNMTQEKADAEIKSMRKAAKKINATPESARAFLIKAGILDKSGKLARKYR